MYKKFNKFSLDSVLLVLLIFSIFLIVGSQDVFATNACVGSTANYTCGNTITQDCTLNGSISVSGGTCFTIGANGVNIDGAGYTLDGGDNSAVGILTNDYDNVEISNMMITDLGWAIYVYQSNNVVITNVNASSGSQLVFGQSSTSLNITNSNCNDVVDCILLEATTDSYFSDITTTTCSDVGFYPYGSSNNNIWKDSTITNCVYGVYFENSQNNNFTNINIASADYGITFDASTGGKLIDSAISSSSTVDIYSTNSYSTPPDNDVINCSFNDALSYADAGQHYVKWYVDVYVNDSFGNAVEGATVTAEDKDSTQAFSETTDATGYISQQQVSEYKEDSSGKTIYSNYTFTGTKTDYDSDSESKNITTNYLDDTITLTLNYNDVEDLSGNSNDGTANNGALIRNPTHQTNRTYFEDGLIAPHLFFENPVAFYESEIILEGESLQEVDVPHSAELNPGTGAFAISLWFNANSFDNPNAPEIISKYDSLDEFYQIRIDYGDKVEFQIDGNGTQVKVTSNSINTNELYHLVAVYDPEGTTQLYLNGLQDGTTTTDVTGSVDPSNPLRIGRGFNAFEFNGSIKNIQLYNRSLTANEAYTLYLNGQPSNNELTHNTNWTNVNGSMKTLQTNQTYFYKLGTGQTHDFGDTTFVGPGESTISSGLYVNAKDNLQVSNCKIKSFKYGIEFTGDYDNNVFDSCEINNTNYGVYFRTANKAYPTNTNITNSEFNSNNHSIKIDPPSGLDYSVSNVYVQGNTISNSDSYGLYLQNTIENIFIYNNNFNSNPYSLYLDQTENNEIKYNVFTSDDISIRTRSETNLTIQNNTFNSANQYAIYSTYAQEGGVGFNNIPEDNTLILENNFNSNEVAIYLGNDGFNITNNSFNSNIKATILPIFCDNTIDSQNEDNGKPIMYYNATNTLIQNVVDYGSLIFCGGSNNLTNVSVSDTTNALILTAEATVLINENSQFDNNSYSIYSYDSYFGIYNSTIQNNELGLYSESSLFEIEDSNFTSNTNDLELSSSSEGISYSSTIANAKVSADATSTFNKKWYLTIYINNTAGNPEVGANVTIYDTNDNLITSQLTDENGYVELWVDEISIASGITTEYNPYEIHVTNGVSGDISNVTIDSDTTYSVTLTEMSCGSTILYDTTLYQNYSCTGDGFIIGSDNIIFNCNGYTIDGDGGTGSWDTPDEGIKIDNKDEVTIKNCVIKDFDSGINLAPSSTENAIIQDNTIQNTNLYAIGLWSGADSATIERNTLENGDGHGIMLTNSISGGTIKHNSIDNFSGTGYGMSFDNSDNVQIYGNNITNSIIGILFGEKTDGTTMYNNILDSNDYNFMIMYDATYNTIYDNTFSNSDAENIYIGAYDNTSLKPAFNTFDSNTISGSGSTDILFYYAENNTISDISFDDISLENSPNTTLLNATYNTISFVDSSVSYIYRKWYMDFYVNDSLGNPVNNAQIQIKNNGGSTQMTLFTDSNGEVSANVSEYKQDGSGTTDYTPLNITASRTGFESEFKSHDLTTNTELNFTLGCDVITGDNFYVNDDTAICQDTYSFNDSASNDLIIINASNITLDCNDAILTGTAGKAITINGNSGVTIQNCDIRNYEWGIYDNDYPGINLSNEYINNSFSEIKWPMIVLSDYNTFSGNQFTSTARKTTLPIQIKSCTNTFSNNQINSKDIEYYANQITEIETPLTISDENNKGQYIFCNYSYLVLNNINISNAAGLYLLNIDEGLSTPDISNVKITNSHYGIYSDLNSHAKIYDSSFDTNEIGVYVLGEGSNIYDNTFTTNQQYAFYISNCNNTFATSNLADSKVLKFTHDTTNSNIVSSSQYSEIEYCNVNNSRITGLTMASGSHGVLLINSNNIDINDSNINSVYNGIRSVGSDYLTISNNTIDGNGERAIDSNDGDYVKIKNNDITGNRGIWVHDSESPEIFDNAVDTITYNGIELRQVTNGELQNNNITNVGDYGLFLRLDTNNTFINNTQISGSGLIDVWLREVNDVEMKNTQITNSNAGERSLRIDGSSLDNFMHDIDTSNTIDGKTIRYYTNSQNQVVPSNPGYVGIVNSTNITFADDSISKNGEGVLVAYSSTVNLTNLTLENNSNGIEVYDSDLIVYDLWIGESDSYGIYLYDSASSTITMTDSLSCGSDTDDIYNSGYTISSASDNYCDSQTGWDDEGGNITNPESGTGCRHSCHSPKWEDLPIVEFYEDNNYTIDLSQYCDSYYTTSISYEGQDKSGITIVEDGSSIKINPATGWTGWENTTFNATNSYETIGSRNVMEFNIIEVSPPIYTLDLTNTSPTHNITLDWEDINGEAGYTIFCANSITDFRNGNWVACGSIDENSTTWTDTNATNYDERYYKVASKTARDVNKLGSLAVGKLNYEFKYSVDGNENIFSLPLYKTSLTTLEDLYNDIDDTSATLYYFNPSTQNLDVSCYNVGEDTLCTMMNLVDGGAYILLTDGTDKEYSLGGEVPEFYNVTLIKPCDNESQWNCSGRNYVGIPLNSTITTPSGFMDAIESATEANVKSITYLDPITQQKQAKIDIGMPFDLGTNFDILPGIGYEIELDTDSIGSFIWTQS